MGELLRHELSLRSIGDVYVIVDPAMAGNASAFIVGDAANNMLVRIQSRCLYGEVFGSVDCDCRDQLDESLSMMADEGRGLVIYLEQEGRGSGLVSKARAYQRKAEAGLDTFAAYKELGLPADAREYEFAISILRSLAISRIRLLTNNPKKTASLVEAGIEVERVPVVTPVHARSADYMAAKKANGHLL